MSNNSTAVAASSAQEVIRTTPSPTTTPTTSPAPSGPTANPTRSPTSPTATPSRPPTLSPVYLPSAAPSTGGTIVVDQAFYTQLNVMEQRKMKDEEQLIFTGVLELSTSAIGLELGEPFIDTECTILKQELGRKLSQVNETNRYVLLVGYIMNYTSRYGLEEIKQYPKYYMQHMNENPEETFASLQHRVILPGYLYEVGNTVDVSASEMEPPAVAPTKSPKLETPVGSPPAPDAVKPGDDPTKPKPMDSMSPSEVPSTMPSIPPRASLTSPAEQERSGFLIGILVASIVVVLSMVTAFFSIWHRRQLRRQGGAGGTGTKVQRIIESPVGHADNSRALVVAKEQFPEGVLGSEITTTIAIRVDQSDAEAGTVTSKEMTVASPQSSDRGSSIGDRGSSPTAAGSLPPVFDSTKATTGLIYPTPDSIKVFGSSELNRVNESGGENEGSGHDSSVSQRDSLFSRGTFIGANLMKNRSGSFSGDSFDGSLSSNADQVGEDEFDRYKDNLLEHLRAEVESKVEGVEGMLSLAIAKTFMDLESTLDLSWIGGEDLGSIEASSLCQAFESTRKRISCDAGQRFFVDMLHKIVFIVHHGLIRPLDGARILHACASIVRLPLLKELPKTTVAVQRLRKSNDLAKGHHLLVEAFSPYGDIIDASIAPHNRGFGFVRFVQPKSVEAVLEKHRRTGIEIEDVTVSIESV